MGDDGKPTEILHLNPIIFDEVYEVEFEDGEIIKCNGEHLWSVIDRDFNKNRRNDKDFTVLRSTDFLYTHYKDRFKKDSDDKDYRFHVKNTKPVEYADYQFYGIHPYLFGLWLGDGTSSNGDLTLCLEDGEEIINYIKPYIKTYKMVKESNKENCYRIHIDRATEFKEKGLNIKDTLKNKLDRLGVLNNKHIPDKYLYGSKLHRLELLLGLMDTDGTCDKTGHCEFTQTNYSLIVQVAQLVRSLGMDCTLSYKEHTNYFKKDGTEADTWRLYFTASKELPVFKLKRKYNRLPAHPLRGSDRKAIVDVRKTGRKEAMRCITVNNESGCYLCGNNYTVTHNSFMSAPFIMARSLLIPSHNTYIMAPSGGQALETFIKLQNLAKDNIASVIGVSSFFLDETVRANAKADPFVHDKNSYHVTLYNGSTINTLNSVATNIVGIRSNLNIYDRNFVVLEEFL